MPQNLNIDDNLRPLVLKAMNSRRTLAEAAQALGVSEKGLQALRVKYNIVQRWVVEPEEIKSQSMRPLQSVA